MIGYLIAMNFFACFIILYTMYLNGKKNIEIRGLNNRVKIRDERIEELLKELDG